MDFFDPWSVGGPRFFLFLLWDFFPQNAKNYLFCMFLVVFDQYSEGGQAFFWPRVRVAGYIWPLVRGGRDFFRPLVRGGGWDVRPRPGKNSAPLDVNSGASLMSTEWAFPTKDMCWKFRTNFVVHSCFMEISNILLNKPQVTLGFVRGGRGLYPAAQVEKYPLLASLPKRKVILLIVLRLLCHEIQNKALLSDFFF